MSELIKCESCGGSNKLAEGINTLFCSFCGNQVKVELFSNPIAGTKNPLLVKPEITRPEIKQIEGFGAYFDGGLPILYKERVSGGWEVTNKYYTKFVPDEYYEEGGYELRLSSKNIASINDVTVWFSDSELESIRFLDLSDNLINSLDGIEKFKNAEVICLKNNKITSWKKEFKFNNLRVIDLSNNRIDTIENLFTISENVLLSNPNFKNYNGTVIRDKSLYIFLSQNPINKFSVNAIQAVRKFMVKNILITVFLKDNPILKNEHIHDFKELEKSLSIDELCDSNDFYFLRAIEHLKNKSKNELKKVFQTLSENSENGYSYSSACFSKEIFGQGDWVFEIPYYSQDLFKKSLHKKTGISPDEIMKGYCFVATATLGNYDHPLVCELRQFRDEWILEKSWGESFVKWYYHYGAIAAKFIEKSFVLKKLSYLLIVKPLVFLSRTLK